MITNKPSYNDFIEHMYKEGFALPLYVDIDNISNITNFANIILNGNHIYLNFDYQNDNKENIYILTSTYHLPIDKVSKIFLRLYDEKENEFNDDDVISIAKMEFIVFRLPKLKYKELKNGFILNKDGLMFNPKNIMVIDVFDDHSNRKNISRFELNLNNVGVFSKRKLNK